jgi:hypothetical protein
MNAQQNLSEVKKKAEKALQIGADLCDSYLYCQLKDSFLKS